MPAIRSLPPGVVNRIAAGRLYQIAQALGVEVGSFFYNLDSERSFKPTPQRLLLELSRHFVGISEARHREALCHPARDLVTIGPTANENQFDAAVVIAEP